MFHLNKIFEGKEIVLFGASEGAKKILETTSIDIQYLVDNNKDKWNKSFLNYKIEPPNRLMVEKKGQVYIIVSSMYYSEITQQLKGYGFKENIDFCYGLQFIPKKLNKNFPLLMHDDLVRLDMSDYITAEQQLVKFLEENYNLVSVYNFGSISTPSISDLDHVIIFDMSVEQLLNVKKEVRLFIQENNLEYYFYHDPIFLNKNMIQYLQLFHTVYNFNKVYGEDIELIKTSFNYEKTLIWNYFFYKTIWEVGTEQHIFYRKSCLLIKNILHSIESNFNFLDNTLEETTYKNACQIVDNVRQKAIGGTLNKECFIFSVNTLWGIIREQENEEIEQLSNILEFGINYFPKRYINLYEKIISGESKYIKNIMEALYEMDISYSDARKLFGAVPIFDLPFYT